MSEAGGQRGHQGDFAAGYLMQFVGSRFNRHPQRAALDGFRQRQPQELERERVMKRVVKAVFTDFFASRRHFPARCRDARFGRERPGRFAIR